MSDAIQVEAEQVHPLTALERRVNELSPDDGAEAFLELDSAIASYLERLKEMREIVRGVALQIIEQTGKPIQCGEIIHFAAKTEKTTKPRSLRDAFDAILIAAGGDVDRITQCLSANAIKYGAARTLFEEAGTPEKWAEVFEVQEKTILVDGKPGKKLVQANAAFMR